jgi:hypothetical protein
LRLAERASIKTANAAAMRGKMSFVLIMTSVVPNYTAICDCLGW